MFYISNFVIYARLRLVLVDMSSVLTDLFKLRVHFVRLFLYITRGLQDLSDLSFIENGKIVGANNTSLLFDLFNHAFLTELLRVCVLVLIRILAKYFMLSLLFLISNFLMEGVIRSRT